MREDPLHRRQRDVGQPTQAEVDLDGLLAHDVQVLLAQHVVDLVDAAGGGALDVEEGQVDASPDSSAATTSLIEGWPTNSAGSSSSLVNFWAARWLKVKGVPT